MVHLKENIKVKALIDKKNINRMMAIIRIVIKIEEIKILRVTKRIIEMMIKVKIEEKDIRLEAIMREVSDKIGTKETIGHIVIEVIEILVRTEIIMRETPIPIVQEDLIDQKVKVDQKDLIDIKEMINMIRLIEVNSKEEIDLNDLKELIEQKEPKEKTDLIDQIPQRDKKDQIYKIDKEIV